MMVSLSKLKDRSIRNMGDVHPTVKNKALQMIEKAYKEGIYAQISSGYRSNKEQQRLYNKGRTTSGNVVTNAKPGQSVHNYGLAIDFFLVSEDGNQALWTVNKEWHRVAAIAKSLGFSWGGDWTSFKDYPHLELTGGLSWRDLKAGKCPTHLLQDVSSSTKDGILERGDNGSKVKQLQEDLLEAGEKLPRYGADGDYGQETEEAVKAFQARYGLEVDGIAGPKTMEKLKEVLKDMAEQKPSNGHEKNWEWAEEKGLFNGKDPRKPVTREQMATVLKRYDEMKQ
ncbi:peptidoglycan-binding protein [Alteribacillus sp. YIM 98480]|uniref:peptidoglycan-binding protein n=1 Tax=Alteribacillus sp. YIM 98480 TaxID=2606599 RepID=UPI00131A8BBC|nr:peptidoglycan-binding protein [Alteribacillus sp. YIM 98480]